MASLNKDYQEELRRLRLRNLHHNLSDDQEGSGSSPRSPRRTPRKGSPRIGGSPRMHELDIIAEQERIHEESEKGKLGSLRQRNRQRSLSDDISLHLLGLDIIGEEERNQEESDSRLLFPPEAVREELDNGLLITPEIEKEESESRLLTPSQAVREESESRLLITPDAVRDPEHRVDLSNVADTGMPNMSGIKLFKNAMTIQITIYIGLLAGMANNHHIRKHWWVVFIFQAVLSCGKLINLINEMKPTLRSSRNLTVISYLQAEWSSVSQIVLYLLLSAVIQYACYVTLSDG